MARVLVTGTTGFVGRHLVAALKPHEVIAAVRQPSAGPSVFIERFDDARSWDAATTGCDALIHLASIAHQSRKYQRANADLYDRVNHRATLSIAESAARAGVRQFIFMSTIGVHGQTTRGRPRFDEDSPFVPESPYAESKVAAERGLMEIAARTGLSVTMIRAPLIHGRGAPGSMAQLVRAIRAGWLLPLASITSRRAFLGIENLTSFIRHRLERRHDSASPLIVADDEQVSASEFATLLAAALGRRARQFPFPPALLARLGFERLVAPLEVDTTRSRSDGWTPPFSLAEGLRRSFAADR